MSTSTIEKKAGWVLPVLVNLVSGGTAGCVAKTAVAPFDRVKILFQVARHTYSNSKTKNAHYMPSIQAPFGVFRTVGTIYKEEGINRLWRGHTATLWRIFPYSSIQFVSYEAFKKV